MKRTTIITVKSSDDEDRLVLKLEFEREAKYDSQKFKSDHGQLINDLHAVLANRYYVSGIKIR